jgi:phosphopantothenoylcysteine decarboxylase/phosphopantothenate--cysteine ligase
VRLVPTPKVIEGVRRAFPDLHMITFNYQEDVSHEQLLDIARERLAQGYGAVVANRGEERGPAGEQVAYLVTGTGEPVRLVGKPEIARGIADYLERALTAS